MESMRNTHVWYGSIVSGVCFFCERQVSVPEIRPKILKCFVTTRRLAHRVCLHRRTNTTIPHYDRESLLNHREMTLRCVFCNASRNVCETISCYTRRKKEGASMHTSRSQPK